MDWDLFCGLCSVSLKCDTKPAAVTLRTHFVICCIFWQRSFKRRAYQLKATCSFGWTSLLLLPLVLHPCVALALLSEFPPFLSWLFINFPNSVPSPCDVLHHLSFGLPLLLSPLPPVLVQRTFLAGSHSFILITCLARLSLANLISFISDLSYSLYNLFQSFQVPAK